MRTLRTAALAVVLVLFLPAAAAVAQVSVDPTVTPELNTGGWVHGMAILLGILGVIVILLVVVAFVRFAPRFSTDETSFKVVRADRVRPGEELPRRTVDIKEAVPVVVAPPPMPERAGVAASAAAAPATAPAAAPEAGGPATATAERAPAPPAQAGPGAETPSEEAPRGEPPSEEPPSDEAPAPRETPAAQAEAPAAAASAEPAAAPAPAEHVEVTMDQEVFERTLQELLAKGTDKRVAEGQARRAGMIAARKKAAGG